jgi:hypothetical protein
MTSPSRIAALLAVLYLSGCALGFDGNQPGPDAGGDKNDDLPGADAAPPPPDAVPTVACPGGLLEGNDPTTGHCFAFFPAPQSWDAAVSACTALGPTAHLAALDTASENETAAMVLGGNQAWIGANDVTTEGSYEWVTGDPVDFTSWREGQPNNQGNEDCVMMRGSDGTWEDRLCLGTMGYLCEVEHP